MKGTRLVDINEELLIRIGDFADAMGVEIYVVGGYVRDLMRNSHRKDIDCTVIGDALDFARRFAHSCGTKAVLYERFRTAMVPVGDFHCEFVGTRKEEYQADSRNPHVSEGTLEDDLRRRDFTVNALAVALNKEQRGRLIDLFDGRGDMARAILRTPLDPYVTFNDDPLRMMRAARFASQLQYTVDQQACEAIGRLVDRIAIISQERISDEFLKLLDSPQPSIGLAMLYRTGLLARIFPELHRLAGVDIVNEGEQVYGHKDVFFHTLQVVDNVAAASDNLWLRFAALMHDIAKPKTKRFSPGAGWSFHGHEEVGARWMKGIFRRMKLPLSKLDYVTKLVRLHQRPMVLVNDGVTDSAIRRLIVQADETLDDLFALCRADITSRNRQTIARHLNNYDIVYRKVLDVKDRDRLRAFQSPVRGDEIMQICELRPSRLVGLIKHEIEEAILDGIIANDHDEAKRYLLEHKDEWLIRFRDGLPVNTARDGVASSS